MLTHFHLYLEAPRVTFGRFMHRLETGYTVHGNLRRERHNPRVRARLMQRETAGVLGMKRGAAVRRQLERVRRRLCADASLRLQLPTIKNTVAKNS